MTPGEGIPYEEELDEEKRVGEPEKINENMTHDVIKEEKSRRT